MRMTAEPLGILTRRYALVADGAPITEIDVPSLASSSAAPIAGQTYHMRRSGIVRRQFTLEYDGEGAHVVASAIQRDPRRRDFAIEVGERRLTLRAVSLLSSAYQLLDGERVIGAIRPTGALHRGAAADLPDDLPLEACVFLLWTVLLLWRGRRVTQAATNE